MKQIHYKAGFKYQITRDYSVKTSIEPTRRIDTEFIKLKMDGWLHIKKGYAWDGPSGPTIDTKNFMRGSLVHDALYQLMRMGLLSQSHRLNADQILVDICREDGMSRFRAWYVKLALRNGGAAAADPANKKVEYTAP